MSMEGGVIRQFFVRLASNHASRCVLLPIGEATAASNVATFSISAHRALDVHEHAGKAGRPSDGRRLIEAR